MKPGAMMNKYAIAEEYLTHWAMDERVKNHCGWDHESILYKILKVNIITVLKIDEISDIDFHKVKVMRNLIAELNLLLPDHVYVITKLYCDQWSIRQVARKPMEGQRWSKSKVQRIKETSLAWLENNINACE